MEKSASRLFAYSDFRLQGQKSAFLGAFILLGFLTYFSALNTGFIGDDFNFLPMKLGEIFSMDNSIYRPLGLTLYAASNDWFGDNAPFALHLVGIILHSFNAYFLFLIAKRIIKNTWISAVLAGIWLVSPTAVEPIYWLSALIFYLPMTALILAAVLLVFSWYGSENADTVQESLGQTLKRGAIIALLWVVSLLFHEIAIVLPVLVALALYNNIFFPRPKLKVRSLVAFWGPIFAAGAAYGAVRLLLDAPTKMLSLKLSERMALTLYAVWRSFLPVERGGIWRIVHFIENQNPLVASGMTLIPLGLGFYFLWRWKWSRPICLGLAATLISALPPVIFTSTGGRYLYLSAAMACLTLAICGGLVLEWSARRKEAQGTPQRSFAESIRIAIPVLLVVILGMNLWRTQAEIKVWTDRSRLVESLQEQIIRLIPTIFADKQPEEHVSILLVDFPIHTLNASGAKRIVRQLYPEYVGTLEARQVFLNDQDINIQKGGLYQYVTEEELEKLKNTEVIIIYCSQQNDVYLFNSDKAPCFIERNSN